MKDNDIIIGKQKNWALRNAAIIGIDDKKRFAAKLEVPKLERKSRRDFQILLKISEGMTFLKQNKMRTFSPVLDGFFGCSDGLQGLPVLPDAVWWFVGSGHRIEHHVRSDLPSNSFSDCWLLSAALQYEPTVKIGSIFAVIIVSPANEYSLKGPQAIYVICSLFSALQRSRGS